MENEVTPAPETAAPVVDSSVPNVSDTPSDSTPTTETQPTTESAPQSTEKPTNETYAKRFAALSHKDRELRQRQLELQRREAELKARESEIQAKAGQKPKSAWDALKAHGFTYQDATMEALGQKPEPTPEDPTEKRFKTLEEQIAEAKKAKEELEAFKKQLADQQQEALRTQILNHIATTVAQGGEKYELLAMEGDAGVQVVFDVMEEYYNKNNGQNISFQAACDLVENFYEDKARKLIAAKKFQPKAPPSTSAKAAPSKPAATLTNADASTPTAKADFSKMSKDEQLDWVASQIKFID